MTTTTNPSPATAAPSAPAESVPATKTATRRPSPSVADDRKPGDPLTKPLWRYKRPDRLRLLDEFLGEQVRVDRWFGRVASHGDQQYTGTLIAVARTTTGSTADFLILKETGGTVWAISTAQVFYMEKVQPPRKRTAAATEARVRKAAARKAVGDAPEAE